MRKKIDYKALCIKAIDILKYIHSLTIEISKFELSKPVKLEIDEIKELSGKTRELKEPYKELFSELMEDICQIEDDLHEIEMVTGELVTKANQLPEESRKAWYHYLGIEEIPKEYEGLSDELQIKLYGMLDKITEIIEDSHKYYSLEREDYVDYEDEIEEQ